MSFLGEIKRRKVFQVTAIYAMTAWLIIQIVDVVGDPLKLPEWLGTVVIVLLATGFPIAVILAWAFELTPDGVVRDQGMTSAAPSTSGRGLELALIGLVVVAMGGVLYHLEQTRPEEGVAIEDVESQREVLPNSMLVRRVGRWPALA